MTKGTSHAWDFGEAVANATVKVSYHTVPKASGLAGSTTMQCSNCHSAHGIADERSAFPRRQAYERSGAAGRAKVVSGNDYCLTCHTSAANATAYTALPGTSKYISDAIWASSTGFDHKTNYSAPGKGHNNPAGLGFTVDSEWVPTVAGIVCKACHSEHGSSNGKLIAEKVNNTDVVFDSASATGYNATYNPFCETCHQGAGLGGVYWPAASTYNSSGHGASTETRTLAYPPNDASASMTLQVKLCKQCHEPHGAGDANGPYLNLTRYFEEGCLLRVPQRVGGQPGRSQERGVGVRGLVEAQSGVEFDRRAQARSGRGVRCGPEPESPTLGRQSSRRVRRLPQHAPVGCHCTPSRNEPGVRGD